MTNPPKALLFDIGGVCVVSPFQAILDYEKDHKIPIGYINYTIAASSPSGSWHKLERGEIPLDDDFFAGFKRDLETPKHWEAYFLKLQTKHLDEGALVAVDGQGIPPVPNIDAKELFWNMMRVSRSPDAFMYPALHKLRRSGRFVMAALSNTVHFPEGIVDEKGEVFVSSLRFTPEQEKLYRESLVADKDVTLGEAGARMDGTPIGSDIRRLFDAYISSAHVGMRKPHREIYEYAQREVSRIAGREVGMGEILFLDDIGQNLRAARQLGMRTLKVELGRSEDAVRELEKITGMSLLDEKARL